MSVLLISGTGCSRFVNSSVAQEDRAAREWLKSWPGVFDWTQLRDVKTVTEAQLPQAKRLLEYKSFVALSDAQASELTATGISGTGDRKPYLLRAIGTRGGKQEVFVRSNGDVWVGGGVNRRFGRVPLERTAVIVWLRMPPTDVYVTFVVSR